ncbi:hypothetical protein FNYG_15926 [Fusarium nygamai]|uniref:Uncharacterized protein n=1 Tax=Gibberella nygamai TaxID=42673 RepID=A0A2K0TZQ7_GIBNY|nr:hypothetical protein FNYG_15926 [Fusarium nygamai]
MVRCIGKAGVGAVYNTLKRLPGPPPPPSPPPPPPPGPRPNQGPSPDFVPRVPIAAGGRGANAPYSGGPALYIYGAVFADKDVTQIVRSLVTPQQTLTLTGDTLVQKLGDP